MQLVSTYTKVGGRGPDAGAFSSVLDPNPHGMGRGVQRGEDFFQLLWGTFEIPVSLCAF